MTREERLNVYLKAAQAGGEAVQAAKAKGIEEKAKTSTGFAPSDIVTNADRESQKAIQEVFEEHRIYDQLTVVLEEDPGQSKKRHQHAVYGDPLDGTKRFRHGAPDYGVMIGEEEDGEATIGAMYYPVQELIIYASKGNGCWRKEKGGEPTRIQLPQDVQVPPKEIRIGNDLSKQWQPEAVINSILDTGATVVSPVSAACGWRDLLTGATHLTYNLGIAMIWDEIAGKACALEAGAIVVNTEKNDKRRDDPFCADWAAFANQDIHDRHIHCFARSNEPPKKFEWSEE